MTCRPLLGTTLAVLALSAVSLSPAPASADNWSGWRGPHGNGLSDETGLPVKWSATDSVLWKVRLPGRGSAGPIVWGDRVFITASDGRRHDQLHFLCLDRRDGHTLWHRRFWGTAPTLYHPQKGSMAVPTPVTDGEHVWAFFGTGDLFCLDVEGNLVWCRSLVQEYEPFQNRWGIGTSPVLAGDLLVLQCDHWGQSYLLGVDKRTGQNRWKTDRAEHVSWSTPLVIDVAGSKEVVVCATFAVKGYDLANGRELWSARGLTRECIPTAVADASTIVAVAGPAGETLAIRPGGRGDVTASHIAWRSRRSNPFVPSPILLDGLYYMVDDRGIGSCLEARTGRRVWQNRLGTAFTSSPVAADGKLYFIDEDGTTTVLKAGRTFEALAKNSLDEPVYSSPAISGRALFIRADQHLYCIIPEPAPAADTPPR